MESVIRRHEMALRAFWLRIFLCYSRLILEWYVTVDTTYFSNEHWSLVEQYRPKSFQYETSTTRSRSRNIYDLR